MWPGDPQQCHSHRRTPGTTQQATWEVAGVAHTTGATRGTGWRTLIIQFFANTQKPLRMVRSHRHMLRSDGGHGRITKIVTCLCSKGSGVRLHGFGDHRLVRKSVCWRRSSAETTRKSFKSDNQVLIIQIADLMLDTLLCEVGVSGSTLQRSHITIKHFLELLSPRDTECLWPPTFV